MVPPPLPLSSTGGFLLALYWYLYGDAWKATCLGCLGCWERWVSGARCCRIVCVGQGGGEVDGEERKLCSPCLQVRQRFKEGTDSPR